MYSCKKKRVYRGRGRKVIGNEISPEQLTQTDTFVKGAQSQHFEFFGRVKSILELTEPVPRGCEWG